MYTNDERFAILHTPGSNTWTLQIKFVQRRDHGTYECQGPIFRARLLLLLLLLLLSPTDEDARDEVKMIAEA
uniref:Immunoglobulin V-set domain-containing protein n=1 Tax=Anopheles dirus TaxID=7168 RepID=A0A182NJ91_9DIPT